MRLLPLVSIFFVIGMAFAYFVVLPFAIHYLLTFSTDIAKPTIQISDYIGFVMTVGLVGRGVRNPANYLYARQAKRGKRSAVDWYRKSTRSSRCSSLAAAITPTPDPFNQTLVAIPLYLLYEFGILFARIA